MIKAKSNVVTNLVYVGINPYHAT